MRPQKIRLLKHTAAPPVPDSGSYGVRFADDRPSVYFYWDDNPCRRSITLRLSSEEAERKAKELARAEQDKLDVSEVSHLRRLPDVLRALDIIITAPPSAVIGD